MNIALVVHDFDPGFGQGRYCLELARRLSTRHRVTIYANRFAPGESASWKQVRIPALRSTAISTVFSFLAASEWRIQKSDHDIIHAQGLTCWNADVITAHICNAARVRFSPPATSIGSRLFPLLVNPVESRFYRQRQAQHLIAISQVTAREIQNFYGWKRPFTVVHHGVDTTRFRPPESEAARLQNRPHFKIPSTGWLWLFVGEAVKGLDQAIHQLPNFPNARLLVVSRSNPVPYQSLARNLGVFERFHFHGPEQKIELAYQAADLFVYPSSYDAFGMVVAEAMASGLPVVAAQQIGAAELIENDSNGLLFDASSASGLNGCLGRIASNPDLSARLGAAARARALQMSWDACATATESVYEKVLIARR